VTDPIDISQSAECAELFAALAAFQGAVTAPRKTASNPHFKSKFADLAEVLETVRAPMTANGLSLTQIPVGACDTHVRLVTLIAHKSGQWIKGTIDMPLAQKTPQAVGSAISYARRYTAMAMLGVAADDDDGEQAQGRGRPATTPAAAPATGPGPRDTRPADTRPANVNTAQAPAVVKRLLGELEAAPTDQKTLAQFYAHARTELDACRADEQQRLQVQQAWGKRCTDAGLKPKDVIAANERAA
jgi:hypothetical protein